MTYNTPELLLVGSAQSLVLGVEKGVIGNNYDADFVGYRNSTIDEHSW